MTKPVKDHVVTIFPDGSVTTLTLEKFTYMLVGKKLLDDMGQVLKENKLIQIRKDEQGEPYLEIERYDGTTYIVEKFESDMSGGEK